MAQQQKRFPNYIIFKDVYHMFLDEVYLIFINLWVIDVIDLIE